MTTVDDDDFRHVLDVFGGDPQFKRCHRDVSEESIPTSSQWADRVDATRLLANHMNDPRATAALIRGLDDADTAVVAAATRFWMSCRRSCGTNRQERPEKAHPKCWTFCRVAERMSR